MESSNDFVSCFVLIVFKQKIKINKNKHMQHHIFVLQMWREYSAMRVVVVYARFGSAEPLLKVKTKKRLSRTLLVCVLVYTTLQSIKSR